MNEYHNINNIEETLWEYIDGTLDAGKTSFVEQLLLDDAEWKSKYAELLEIRDLMTQTELEQPSMRFTQNVMEEISRLYIAPATKNYINKNIIRGIMIFFLTTIIALVGYTFGMIDWSQPEEATFVEQHISKINWSSIFNSTYMNIFIMINIVLALMLFDMYLVNRKKTVKQKAGA